jgi:hypothetical protein
MEGCIRLRRHSKYSTMVWEDLCPLKDFHSFLTLFRDVVIKLILSLVDTSLSSQAWRTSLSQTRQGRRGSRVGNTGCSLPRTMLLCPNTGTSPPILVTQIRSFCRFRSRVVWFRHGVASWAVYVAGDGGDLRAYYWVQRNEGGTLESQTRTRSEGEL